MPHTIARTRPAALHALAAHTLRTAAVALLVLGLQSPVTVAAAGGSTENSTTFAVRGPIAASAVAIAEGPAAGRVELDDDGEDRIDEGDDEGEAGCRDYDDGEDRCLDKGEDRFDAGDDEFNCDNVNEGEDPCHDNPPDRVDAGDDDFDAGDDGFDAGCANYDDGEDRCLDKGADQRADQVDAGNAVDNELAPGCSEANGCEQPGSSQTTDATAPVASSTPSVSLAALAAVIALGGASWWLLRRANRG